MPLINHVSGEASIWVDTGAGLSLQELGVSVDGVEIDPRLHTEDLLVDTTGPGVPFDVQYFLEDALITFDLVWYDVAVLNAVLPRAFGNGVQTAGIMQAAGQLFVQQGSWFRLLIKSTPNGTGVTGVEPCWNFPRAYLADNVPFRIGTRRTAYHMTWRAILNTDTLTGGQQSSSGLILYNHTCT